MNKNEIIREKAYLVFTVSAIRILLTEKQWHYEKQLSNLSNIFLSNNSFYSNRKNEQEISIFSNIYSFIHISFNSFIQSNVDSNIKKWQMDDEINLKRSFLNKRLFVYTKTDLNFGFKEQHINEINFNWSIFFLFVSLKLLLTLLIDWRNKLFKMKDIR